MIDVVSSDKVIGVIKDELELNDLVPIKPIKITRILNFLSIQLLVLNEALAYMLYCPLKY